MANNQICTTTNCLEFISMERKISCNDHLCQGFLICTAPNEPLAYHASKVEIFFLDIDWGLPKVQNHLTNQKMQNISNWQCFRTVYTQVSLTRTVQNPYFPSLSFCFSLNDHVSFNTAIIISTPDCVSTVTCTRIDWEFTSPSLTPSEFNLNLFLFIEYTVRALKHYSNLSVSMSI